MSRPRRRVWRGIIPAPGGLQRGEDGHCSLHSPSRQGSTGGLVGAYGCGSRWWKPGGLRPRDGWPEAGVCCLARGLEAASMAWVESQGDRSHDFIAAESVSKGILSQISTTLVQIPCRPYRNVRLASRVRVLERNPASGTHPAVIQHTWARWAK